MEPSITYRGTVIEKPKVLLLRDDSQSMKVTGPHTHAERVVSVLKETFESKAEVTERTLENYPKSEDNFHTVIMLSDGRPMEIHNPQRWSEVLKSRGAIVHSILMGSPDTPLDAVVSNLTGPDRMSASNQVSLTARYRLHLPESNGWDIVLRNAGQEVARKAARAGATWQEQVFDYVPQKEGIYNFAVTLENTVATSELTPLNNNAQHIMEVRDDALTILLLDTFPRWQSRYIISLFEREPKNEVMRKYLSVETEAPFFSAAMEQYDAIFIGDLNTREIPLRMQEQLESYVGSRGGFLVVLAGPRGVGVNALRDLIPVRGNSATKYLQKQTGVLKTGQAEIPGLFTPELWKALAPIHSYVDGVELKPGATSFLQTTNGTPLVAAQRYGAGRVLWVGTAETWRWRDRIGGEVHDAFWKQLVSWGVKSQFRGKDERLKIAVDRTVLGTNDSLELLVRASVGGTSALITNINGAARKVTLQEKGNLLRAQIAGLSPGTWVLQVTNSAGLSEEARVIVREQPNHELIELSSDPVFMERLAAAGGGKMFTTNQVPALINQLQGELQVRAREQVKTSSLWDNYFALVLFTGLLAAEWLLRKRRGLD